MLTVGIDTGGTFTDVFISGDHQRVATVKVPTTPHDLTVCFAEAIRASADAFGLALEDFLREAAVIRFSSTIGTNTVLTRSGARLGLLVTTGAEDDLYGAAEGGTIHQFVPAGAVAGIEEEVSPGGELLREPDPNQVSRAVRGLLELGARLLVVSLRNASANSANERTVRRLIDQSYPRHYLGALPVLQSTQIAATFDNARRTASAVVNAYMHQKLATSLYRAEDDLRRSGFRHPLLIVNTDGGVTRVAKTRALTTYQSGPTAGIHASALLCRELGIEDALTADVGGTSTDIGLLARGQPVLRDTVDVGGMPVLQPSVELLSFGVGGGSIARVSDGLLRVGPKSAGAAPGPACFALGGREPTPTDAWLVLGYLTADYYLGGRKRLDVELARRALATVADPLGVSVEEAALAICNVAEQTVAEGIEELLGRPGVRELIDTRERSRLALIAYGGGGGLLLPGVARRLGLRATVISRYSPVFSAFGVSTFDVRHRYQACCTLNGQGPDAIVEELSEAARRDMRGEGFAPADVELSVNVSEPDGDQIAAAPASAVDALDLPRGHLLIFELQATCAVAKPMLPHENAQPSQPEPQTRRQVWLSGGQREVPVYDRDALAAGAELTGPTLIEASDTTYIVPEGSRCRLHRSGSAVIEEG
jgi:N-methylhydantoinase A/oxoprolinase/acetone carboxylase beta subunit